MLRQPSGLCYQSRAALAGSGALSHVYVQYPPLKCSIPGAVGLYYDDANKLLLAPTSNQVFSWQANQFTSPDGPNVIPINEGPVLSIRYSLDGKFIGVQRSQQEVEFINRETFTVFNQRCKVESECILGFFWTDCPTCDIVFVKTSGLDLYSLHVELNGLKLVETKRLNVNWYVYTHESRLVLLASGMQCKAFTGFQFSAGGIVRLPKFDMAMTKAEVNKKPILVPEDLHLATMYGRIYCLQVDRVSMQLHLYRFYRDAVLHQGLSNISCITCCSEELNTDLEGTLPIYSTKVAVSVVDNVLLVHQVDAKVVLLYDIFADSKAPISAPLPLLVRGPLGATIFSSRNNDRPSSSSSQATEVKTLTTDEGSVYGDGWIFLNPDMICDNIHGLLWRIHLDLEAIAASSSEVPSLLAFLQRRRLQADKAKQLSLAVMRSIILERRPLSVIANAMDVLTISYSQAMKLANCLPGCSSNRIIFQQPSVSCAIEETDSEESVTTGHVSSKLGEASGGTLPNSLPQLDGCKETSSSNVSAKDETRTVIESESSSLSNEKVSLQSESSEIQAGGPLESTMSDLQSSRTTSTIISPDEMYNSVFALVEEEMAVDPMYLVAVFVEYLRSAAAEKLKVHPGLHVLIVQLLARDERYAELGQFVSNKILEPSKEVAMELLETGSHHLPTRRLGMDMLRQLSCHSEYVALLLQDGCFIEALRYVRRNKVHTIPPNLFLEAAAATRDSQKLASVLRFCADFVPNFEQTHDYNTFFGILNEINSLVTT